MNVLVVLAVVVSRKEIPIPLPLNLPPELLNNCSFDLYRPYGASTAIQEGVVGTLLSALQCGRSPGGSNLIWTHVLYLDPPVDIRDNLFRPLGALGYVYSDGDRVRQFTSFGAINYSVVFVDYERDNTTDPSQDNGIISVYLFRTTLELPPWP